MNIDRNNYEVWFIDYLEGRLDNNAIDDFIEFIQQNPDLKEELSLFEVIPVVPESSVFKGKKDLYKSKYDHEKEFNEAAIGRLEGDLTPEEIGEFESYLSLRPEKRKEAGLFLKTLIHPDESIVFHKRKSLYRKSRSMTIFLWTSGVAAILIVALAFFTLTEKSVNQQMITKKLAETEVIPQKEYANPEGILPDENKNKNKPENTITTKPKQDVKKPENNNGSTRSLRENNQGRLDSNDTAAKRIPEEVPAPIKSRMAAVAVPAADVSLAEMHYISPKESPESERLLADVITEKTGIENISVRTITRAGLSLFSNLSGDKFTYDTNKDGKITGLNFDSRLLAFSFPTSPDK